MDSSVERTLTVSEPANYEITIDSIPGDVAAGDEIQVQYTVENSGDVEGTPTVTFDVNETEEDTTSFVLGAGQRDSGNLFTYTTSGEDGPVITVTLSIEGDNGDTVTEEVTVNQQAN